jgi:hypothetical protein
VRAAAVVIVVLGLGWVWTHHRQTSLQHRLAAVATQLAGRPVGVRCQGFWAEMLDIGSRSGEVDFPVGRPPDHMFLVRGVCDRLRHFMDGGSHRNLDCLTAIDWTTWSIDADYEGECERHAQGDAEAINTLAHESMHLRGITSESEAQCLAIQADAWTVVRLGGTAAEGDAVANYLLALQPLMPPEYQSSGCRAGGQLDATPLTREFPSETSPAIPPLTLPSAS